MQYTKRNSTVKTGGNWKNLEHEKTCQKQKGFIFDL